MRLRILLTLSMLLSAAAAAHAGTEYQYTFTMIDSQTAIFDEDAIVISPGYLDVVLLPGSSTDISRVYLNALDASCPGAPKPSLYNACADLLLDDGREVHELFADGPLLHVGTYSADGGSLVIAALSSPVAPTVSPAPEPGTLVLLGSGLLGFVGLARRRFTRG